MHAILGRPFPEGHRGTHYPPSYQAIAELRDLVMQHGGLWAPVPLDKQKARVYGGNTRTRIPVRRSLRVLF